MKGAGPDPSPWLLPVDGEGELNAGSHGHGLFVEAGGGLGRGGADDEKVA